MTRSSSSPAPSERKADDVLADLDQRIAGPTTPAAALIAEWLSSPKHRDAAHVLAKAMNARTRFRDDRTPLRAPSGLPLPPL